MAREIVAVPEIRPPRRVTSRVAVEKAEQHVRRNLKKYLKKLEELAQGIVIAEPSKKLGDFEVLVRYTETGQETVVGQNLTLYTTAPSLPALQYLSDRAMGKTPQRYEITGDEGGAIEVIPWLPPVSYIEGESQELPLNGKDKEVNQEEGQVTPSRALSRTAGSQAGSSEGVFTVEVPTEADEEG